MSDLLQRIRTDLVSARKAGEAIASNVLRTIIAECEKISHGTMGQKPRTLMDRDVQSVVTKAVKDIGETQKLIQDNPDRAEEHAKLDVETSVLATYLPKQLNDDELKALIRELAEAGNNFSQIMIILRDKHAGTYEARTAVGVVKEVLGVS